MCYTFFACLPKDWVEAFEGTRCLLVLGHTTMDLATSVRHYDT